MSDTDTPMIDTTNKFLVAMQGHSVVFLRPLPQRISEKDALLLAAFLVALCDQGVVAEDSALNFAEVQKAVNRA